MGVRKEERYDLEPCLRVVAGRVGRAQGGRWPAVYQALYQLRVLVLVVADRLRVEVDGMSFAVDDVVEVVQLRSALVHL